MLSATDTSSADYADAYEGAKLQQEKASEAANTNHAKKRGMLTEAKHFKEQTAEVKQWEKLMDSKDAMIQRHLLWRLYHITNEINNSTRQVEEASDQLAERRSTVVGISTPGQPLTPGREEQRPQGGAEGVRQCAAQGQVARGRGQEGRQGARRQETRARQG